MTKKQRMKKAGAFLFAALVLGGVSGCKKESVPPNDPLYPEQKSLALVHLEDAWEAGLTGKGVTIGLIDSGVAEHEDLKKQRVSGRSYVDEDPQDLTDVRGHGTFLAGLLAATRNNGKGIAGMTDSKIRVYKVIGDQPHIGMDHVAEAIRDAVEDECDVINLSMGTPQEDERLKEAVEYALSKDVIVVAAVGGDGENPYYPAAYEGVIGVDAVNEDLEPVERAGNNESVDVTAPGASVLSLKMSGGYDREGEGASYAAAQVTAMAAFARQEEPEITAEEFLELLKHSVQDKGETGYDPTYGWGVIDFALFTREMKGED